MNSPKISLIVAMDQKRGIGKDNKISWKIPGEQKRFKEITIPHPIIMGRKTFESIGRILPNRQNIVITRDPNYHLDQAIIAYTLDQAISQAKKLDKNEIFIIGGGQVFRQAIDLADRLYLTIVQGDYRCDTFFPDHSDFKKEIKSEKVKVDKYSYQFIILER